VFNVENGCSAPATVSFRDFTLTDSKNGKAILFVKPPPRVTVAAEGRERIDLTVAVKGDELKAPLKFVYKVELAESPKAPRGPAAPAGIVLDGTIYVCSQPPCPPRG
jgi:hypothetical protein